MSAPSAYRAALEYLFARTTGASRLGLERTAALCRALGDPQRRLSVFHVAGTNGKGSVAATLESVLRGRGLRVGKYTSPHLVDFRERIVVDGVPVPEADVVEFIHEWTPEVERIGATFFEATTVLAFAHFAAAAVDVAVVEVGLGGRLDSTNVVDPVVAAVTAIGRDHTEVLGDTLEAIAAEKAGIFKAGRPAVIGERDAAVRATLRAEAAARSAAPVRAVADEWTIRDVEVGDGTSFTLVAGGRTLPLRTPLVGAHQAFNTATALLALDAAPANLRVAPAEAARHLAAIQLPGRFQRSGAFIFDVAHNADGAAVLARTLAALRPPTPIVALLCVLRDKDWLAIIRELAACVDHFVLTDAPTAPAGRAWDVTAALAAARELGASAEVERDFDRALDLAERRGRTVLVTGSFHTVGDAMARLQVAPLAG
ncbi:MAG TPA: Mur ligase family protein [Gemmatimonadaceae bacterium]|nr:Mur ligase family protein [Gemmatimonadaceae bacterium]